MSNYYIYALNSIPWDGPEDINEDDADDEDDREHDVDNAADDKMHRSFRRVLPKYSISSSFLVSFLQTTIC